MRIAAIVAPALARAGAGDGESGAVVGRGADDRQAERDVDAAVEIERLQRDQRLVVVHAQRHVVAGARVRGEQRVGGVRAGRVDPLGAQRGDGGGDDARFLVAEPAVLAGVRIERGDRDARVGDAEVARQRRCGDPRRGGGSARP